MSPWIDNRVITIYDPTTRPASMLGLELVVLGLAALTCWHAVRAHRAGDRAALLTWITIAVYGLAMEFLSYNLVDNFAHGQFTVMFYDRQLPLYVTAIYPVLLYTGIATARGLGLPRPVEGLAAGLLIVAMDAPFDVVGPTAGWWRWFADDPNIAYRWYGVPVTSYYWHFAFGGILAVVTAMAAGRAARRRQAAPSPWLALPLSVVVIVLGMLAFAPFHLFKSIGVADGVIVGAALAASAVVVIAVAARSPTLTPRDRTLATPWLVFYGLHIAVIAASASGAGGDDVTWGGRIGFLAVVAAVAAAVNLAGLRAALGARTA